MDNSDIRAMVLAAGAGTRLDPLTRALPKPLVPIANRAVMEYGLRLLKRHNITQAITNLHYLSDKVTAYFSDVENLDMSLQCVVEKDLSGDAGGVRACKSFLCDNTFVVMMGDIVTDIDLSYLIARHKASGAIATLALKQMDDVRQFGVAALDKDGFITQFQEKPEANEAISNLASLGIYVLEPEIFKFIPWKGEYSFGRQLFLNLLKLNLPIQGVQVHGYWSDIGTITSYRKTCFDAIDGLIDLELPSVVFNKDTYNSASQKIELNGNLIIGQGSTVGAGVVVNGHAIIGDNCTIESGVLLENAIIWSNATVAANSVIKRTVIGENCQLRKYSHFTDTAIVEADIDKAKSNFAVLNQRNNQAHSAG